MSYVMKNKIIFVLFFSLFFLSCKKSMTTEIIVQNPEKTEHEFELYMNEEKFTGVYDEKGIGKISVTLSSPKYATLTNATSDPIKLYLENGEIVRINIKNKGVIFEGKNRKENEFLNNEPQKKLSADSYKLSDIDFLKCVNDVIAENKDRLSKMNLSNQFTENQMVRIEYDVYFSMLKYPNRKGSDIITKFLNDKIVDNATYLIHNSYNQLIISTISEYSSSNDYNERIIKRLEYIENNFKTADMKEYLVCYFILSHGKSRPFNEQTILYFNKNVTDVKSITTFNELCQWWGALERGKPVPEMKVINMKGDTVSMKQFKDKVIYIDFWYTNCPACRHQIRTASPALHDKFKNSNVIFLYVSADTDHERWLKAIAEDGADGYHVRMTGGKFDPFAKAMNVLGYPCYAIIDKNQNIFQIHAPNPSSPNISLLLEEALKIN